MNEIKKVILSPERKISLIKEIIDYFATEKDIEIGNIAAEEILNFLLVAVEREIYNQAINDVQKVIREGAENIAVNVDLLQKQ